MGTKRKIRGKAGRGEGGERRRRQGKIWEDEEREEGKEEEKWERGREMGGWCVTDERYWKQKKREKNDCER